MGKKKGQQESVQLSFFDAYEPKVPEIAQEPQEESEIPSNLIEEDSIDPQEPEEKQVIEENKEELITEEPVQEEITLIEEKSEIIIYDENRKPSLTEQIFDPMVIYFNTKDCPKENIEEEQGSEDDVYPVMKQEPLQQEEPSPERILDKESAEEETVNSDHDTDTKELIIEVEEANNNPESIGGLEVEQEIPSFIPPVVEETGRGKRILITGASGFIGGFLVEAALKRGYEVWAGIRMNSNRSRLTDERIQFIDLAYDNEDILAAQLENFREEHGVWDYIIHNAGVTKTADKMDFFRVNAENTHRFIEALNTADCRPGKFLLMSSLSSYGMGDEKDFTPIGLEDAQRPDTAYGLSKLEAENYVRRQTYFPYIILRPTGVYGPGDRDYFMEIKTINSGFDFAVGMTPQRITFIYVEDLATVAFLALEKEELQNKHYFVADGDVYTDQSFAHMIQDILGRERVLRARIPTGLVYVACLFSEFLGKISGKGMTLNTDKYKILKQRNWICDVRPLQDDLGFTPAYSLRKGLTESIAWYREHKWL